MADPGESSNPTYLRSRFLDELYEQHRVGPTPFSSGKRPRAQTERTLPPVSVATRRETKGPKAFESRMNYPAAVGKLAANAMPNQAMMVFASPLRSETPNPFWLRPPPTVRPVPDHVTSRPIMRRDDWHPLITTIAVAQHGAAPMPVSRTTTGGAEEEPNSQIFECSTTYPSNAGANPRSLTMTAARLVAEALAAAKPPQPASRLTNTGLLHETGPPPAFRALSCNVRHILQARDPRTRGQLERELTHGGLVVRGGVGNDGTISGRMSTSGIPHPGQSPHGSPFGPIKAQVHYNYLTGDMEIAHKDPLSHEEGRGPEDTAGIDFFLDETDDIDDTLGFFSHLRLWNECVAALSGGERRPPREATDGSDPMRDAIGRSRVKSVTARLLSLHHPTWQRGALSRYLCEPGIRMGTMLTLKGLPAPPSASKACDIVTSLPSAGSTSPRTSSSPRVKTSWCLPVTRPPPPSSADIGAVALRDGSLASLLASHGPEVEQIDLPGMDWISESTLDLIGRNCPNLRLLNLNGCRHLTDDALQRIAVGCPLLVYINVAGCPEVSGAAISDAVGHCGRLQVLCAAGVTPLDTVERCALWRLFNARGLRALDLSHCRTLTDASLVAVASYCPGLEMLNVSGCTGIGDLGITAVGKRCTNMRAFAMMLCDQDTLTAEGLGAVCVGARNLKALDMAGCTQLDDPILARILGHTLCLETLSLGGCPKVTGESIALLSAHCPKLRRLDIDSCPDVPSQVLLDLIHDVQSLRHLSCSESGVSPVEATMLKGVRATCRVVQHNFQPRAPRDDLFRVASANRLKT